MRFGRVFPLCLLLLVAISTPVFAQAEETAPVEAQTASPELVQETAPAHVEGAVHEEEGGGTMPQLDPTYYASQLFWLLIAGGLMYLMMSKVALPRVARILEVRDNQVRKDLEKAARLKLEAEDVKVTYLRALRDADERARALTERTLREIREKQDAALSEIAVRTQLKIAETEKTLLAQKEAVLIEVSAISKKLSDTIIGQLSKKAA